MPELEKVVAAVATSKKYRSICTDTIRRIAERELASHGDAKAAAKATKRKLHQVYGAFELDFDHEAAYQRLQHAYNLDSDDEIESACREILALHSSSRERLLILDRFYSAIFEITGQPTTVLDLGCGLSPLALPWMGPIARYIALDIDMERVRFLNRFLSLAGFEPLARCQDVLARPPDDAADVSLLLKMSPTLERQEPGATHRLVERLGSSFVVVSYAVKSLSGRDKGMLQQYQRQFLELAGDRRWSVEELVFETELVLVVRPHRHAENGTFPRTGSAGI
jgi:16S rRNA (guanine(1405)-N(7))-methyltransferase